MDQSAVGLVQIIRMASENMQQSIEKPSEYEITERNPAGKSITHDWCWNKLSYNSLIWKLNNVIITALSINLEIR